MTEDELWDAYVSKMHFLNHIYIYAFSKNFVVFKIHPFPYIKGIVYIS